MSLLAQRAKVNWLMEGDSDSKFFHSIVNQRRTSNNIWVLLNSTVHRITDQHLIVDHVVQFYTQFFGTLQWIILFLIVLILLLML